MDPYENYINLLDDGDEEDETQLQAAIAANLEDSVEIKQRVIFTTSAT